MKFTVSGAFCLVFGNLTSTTTVWNMEKAIIQVIISKLSKCVSYYVLQYCKIHWTDKLSKGVMSENVLKWFGYTAQNPLCKDDRFGF